MSRKSPMMSDVLTLGMIQTSQLDIIGPFPFWSSGFPRTCHSAGMELVFESHFPSLCMIQPWVKDVYVQSWLLQYVSIELKTN